MSGCVAPLIIGGGAVLGMAATRPKGISGTYSDNKIATIIGARFYKFNASMQTEVAVIVNNGEVLLAGTVTNPSWSMEAEKIAQGVEGVTLVINNINTSGHETIGSVATDGFITSKIKSQLLLCKDVYSLNYQIKTVNQIVYVQGNATTQEQIDKVLDIISKVGLVKKVVNLIKLSSPD